MPWDWSEIEREWLHSCAIALRPDDVVRAFDTVERVLGRDWIESIRSGLGGAALHWGAMPTLTVAAMGQRLESLDSAVRAESLVGRLRQST